MAFAEEEMETKDLLRRHSWDLNVGYSDPKILAAHPLVVLSSSLAGAWLFPWA